MNPRKARDAAGGIITQRDPRRCIVRLRTPAGLLTPAQLEGLGRCAREAGLSTVHLTTRQAIELPDVDPASLEPLLAALAENGTPLGTVTPETLAEVLLLGDTWSCIQVQSLQGYCRTEVLQMVEQ